MNNFEAMPTPEASPATDRFIIRGHHINYLTSLVPPINRDPEEMAQNLRGIAAAHRYDASAQTMDWNLIINSKGDHPQYWSAYSFDLIGESEAQGDEFEVSLSNTLRSFRDLEDNAEVVLTARGLDEVCGACIFQLHCQVPENMEEDAEYLNIFEDVLAYERANGNTAETKLVRLSDGDILTTAKTVRHIMSRFAVSKGLHGDPYSDALERREKYGNVYGGPDVPHIEKYYDSRSEDLI